MGIASFRAHAAPLLSIRRLVTQTACESSRTLHNDLVATRPNGCSTGEGPGQPTQPAPADDRNQRAGMLPAASDQKEVLSGEARTQQVHHQWKRPQRIRWASAHIAVEKREE